MQCINRSINIFWMVPGLLIAATGCNQSGTGTPETAGGFKQVPEPSVAVTNPGEPVRAYVRAVHAVPGAGPVTVSIDGHPIVNDLAFGSASEFVGLQGEKIKIHATRDHKITVTDANDTTLGTPLSVDLERGEDVTVVIGGAPGKVTLTPFEHTNRGADPDQAKIAVMHADKTLPEVSITVDGKSWPGDISFGEVTGYRELAAGQHTMKVMYDKTLVGIVDVDRRPGASPPPPVAVRATNLITLTHQLNLQDGKVYSVVVYGDAGGTPKLRFIEDKFVPALVRAPDAGVAPATNADGTTDSTTTDTSSVNTDTADTDVTGNAATGNAATPAAGNAATR